MGPSPFRIKLMRLQEPGFPDFVQKSWKEADCDGWMGFRLCQKLKLLKHEMRDWRKTQFQAVEVIIASLLAQLHELDALEEVSPLS